MIYEYMRSSRAGGEHLRHAQVLDWMTKGDKIEGSDQSGAMGRVHPLPPHPLTKLGLFAPSVLLKHLIFTPRNRENTTAAGLLSRIVPLPHGLSANV